MKWRLCVGLLGVGCGPPSTFGMGTDGIEPLVGERHIQVAAGGGAALPGGFEDVTDVVAGSVVWTEPLSNRVSITTSIGGGLGDAKGWALGAEDPVFFVNVGAESRFRMMNDLDAPFQLALISGVQWQTTRPSIPSDVTLFGGSGGRAPHALGLTLGAVASVRAGPVRPYFGLKANGSYGTWLGLHFLSSVGATWQPREAGRLKLGAEATLLYGSEGNYVGGSAYARWTLGKAKAPPDLAAVERHHSP